MDMNRRIGIIALSFSGRVRASQWFDTLAGIQDLFEPAFKMDDLNCRMLAKAMDIDGLLLAWEGMDEDGRDRTLKPLDPDRPFGVEGPPSSILLFGASNRQDIHDAITSIKFDKPDKSEVH